VYVCQYDEPFGGISASIPKLDCGLRQAAAPKISSPHTLLLAPLPSLAAQSRHYSRDRFFPVTLSAESFQTSSDIVALS
jgi:hypothetical protein